LPGPSPLLFQPIRQRFFEIPIAIQDRAFNADGSLFYPDTRSFFDGIEGPYAPDSDVSPIWNPEFFGNVMVVNGATWPYLDVEQRRYRFRFLNGCDARFLMLQFPDKRIEVWQIGAEGGFLPAPVRMNDFPPDGVKDGTAKLLMCPAERADVIVDFSNLPVGTRITLRNLGPDEPFGGFPTAPADPDTTGQVMEFRVVRRVGLDLSTPPRFMQLPPIAALTGGATRQLALLENMSQTFDGPTEAVLGRLENGVAIKQMWMEPITENPAVGATEVWEFYNFTADAHPMHVHEVAFQLINRQPLKRDATGEVIQPVEVIGTPRGPEAWEVGLKDTVIAYPGEVTRIRAKFDTPGLFVWHCHIVEHEDNEMMRPYAVGPIPQPQAMAAATQPSTPIEDELVEEVEDAYKVYLPYTNK
jgi:FtsP/CotA-like multicopper oxidase with cupredoxin domain